MNCPKCLLPGARVALVATARKVGPEEVQPAIDLLRSWQLEPVVDEGLYAAYNQMAGHDAHRAAMLQRYVDDDSVDAILCVRGGYGTVRVVDRVDFRHLIRHPKWIIGYSDVTVLHSHLHTTLNLATLHATMPVDIPADPSRWEAPALSSMHDALFWGKTQMTGAVGELTRPGVATAPLVGGNLSILYSLCGSPSDIDTTDSILLIEDLDEYVYHIDRMMQNLLRTGKLDRLKGLIVGAMSDMHDNTIPFGKSAEEIISDIVADFDFPVLFHAPIGHIGLENRALLLGVPTTLDISSQSFSITQQC